MTQFVRHSRNMTIEQANAISKKTGGLFVFNFLQWHIAPKAHVCFLDEELEAELLEKAQLSKAQLVAILRYFRSKNIIKAVRNVDEVIGYGINPELTGEDNLQELYDSWVDGCWRCNNKATQEFKEKLGSKRENKGKSESNKPIVKKEKPKGEPKEIVIHPEEEVIAQVQGYNPVTTTDVLEQLIDYAVERAPKGIDKNKLGRWCQKGNLMSWVESKLAMHRGADPGEIVKYYMTSGSLSELYDTFNHKKS